VIFSLSSRESHTARMTGGLDNPSGHSRIALHVDFPFSPEYEDSIAYYLSAPALGASPTGASFLRSR